MQEGNLVYLTIAAHKWVAQKNPDLSFPVMGHLATIDRVLNWASPEGKTILDERKKVAGWSDLKSRDFKYILNVYFPELGKNKGSIVPMVLPKKYPGSTEPLFLPVPQDMLHALQVSLPKKKVKKVVSRSTSSKRPAKSSKSSKRN